MNQMSNYILGIYQVMLMVRDTLEYTMQGRKPDIRGYNERKAGFQALLTERPLCHALSPQTAISRNKCWKI